MRNIKWLLSFAVLMFTSPVEALSAAAVAENQTGTIAGRVRYDGKRPTRKVLKVNVKAEVCHTEPIISEDLIVSEGMGVKWAVVSIKDLASEEPTAKPDKGTAVILDQKNCRFVPHVVLVQAGQTLRILNSDGILHNVHTKSLRNRPFNRAMPGMFKQMEVTFARPERVKVKCDAHDWMSAWIVVYDQPYCAVTDSAGSFRIQDVPPGTYTLEIWHETLGVQRQQVTVKSAEETNAEIVFTEKKAP